MEKSLIEKLKDFADYLATMEENCGYEGGSAWSAANSILNAFEEKFGELPTIAPHVMILYKCFRCDSYHYDLEEANECCPVVNTDVTEVTEGMIIEDKEEIVDGCFYVSAVDGSACWIRPIDNSSLGFVATIDNIQRTWRKA